jgi:hypothetical protein
MLCGSSKENDAVPYSSGSGTLIITKLQYILVCYLIVNDDDLLGLSILILAEHHVVAPEVAMT